MNYAYHLLHTQTYLRELSQMWPKPFKCITTVDRSSVTEQIDMSQHGVCDFRWLNAFFGAKYSTLPTQSEHM